MRREQALGTWSLAAAGGALILAQAFHPIMQEPVRVGLTAAWLATLVAGLLSAVLFWAGAAGVAALPGGNLISLARAAAGWPGAAGTALLAGALLVYHSGFVLRQTSEMVVASLYPHTPQTLAMASLALCSLYVAYGGTSSVVRACRLLLPIFALTILFLLAANVGWGEARFLLPFWGPGPAAVLGNSARLAWLFSPALLPLLAAGQARGRSGLGRAGAAAIAGTSLVLAWAEASVVKTFPLPMAFSVTYPLHELSRLVTGGRFFQRVEGLWLTVWVLATVFLIGGLLHAAAVAWTGAFRLPTHRLAVLPLVTLAATVALFPPDQGQAVAWHTLAAWPVALVAFGLPAALAALGRLRRGKARRGG